VVFWLGVGLLMNGAHLVLASRRKRPIRAEILWFALGDMVWWLAVLALIGAGVWITTAEGAMLAGLVSVFVAGLGTAQLFLAGRERSGLTAGEQWRRIGQSWLALPLWVKLWLFALNAVFIGAPAFVEWDAARVILIGYVASGPLLLGLAGYAGGLTRHMGIGHLVTLAPMLVWLVIDRGLSDLTMAGSGFGVVFVGMVVICRVFDLYDLVRWLRGERDVLGSQTDNLNVVSDALQQQLARP